MLHSFVGSIKFYRQHTRCALIFRLSGVKFLALIHKRCTVTNVKSTRINGDNLLFGSFVSNKVALSIMEVIMGMFSVKLLFSFRKSNGVMNRTRGARDTTLTRDFSRILVKYFLTKSWILFVFIDQSLPHNET